MLLSNAIVVARMASRLAGEGGGGGGFSVVDAEDVPFGSFWWFVDVGISCLLVLFAGIMSGLTLGLMSLGLVDLEILQRSGTSLEKKQAAAIFPVVQKQHQLLVTLLLCNAVAMEIIPQAICSRYGLAVGANFVGLVHILMIVCYPIAYPIGKILDFLLGHNESALFRRAQLKALVSIHSKEAGKGGELTHDEATIISGALDLTEKTAEAAMTPIESTFSLDVNSKLDWVPADMPLYDILNEFQKGSSHMAAVIKTKMKARNPPTREDGEKTCENKVSRTDFSLISSLLQKQDENSECFIDVEKGPYISLSPKKCSYGQVDAAFSVESQFSMGVEDGEVIGIITLEDVFEELLQEEIVDETDEFIDVHKRIRVAAAAAASSVARAPSSRKLTAQKPGSVHNRQGNSIQKNPSEEVRGAVRSTEPKSLKPQEGLLEPLLVAQGGR